MKRLAEALNSIGDEAWSFIWLVYGTLFYALCVHLHTDLQVAAGVIGAATMLFQKSIRAQTVANAPNAQTLNVSTPPNPT